MTIISIVTRRSLMISSQNIIQEEYVLLFIVSTRNFSIIWEKMIKRRKWLRLDLIIKTSRRILSKRIRFWWRSKKWKIESRRYVSRLVSWRFLTINQIYVNNKEKELSDNYNHAFMFDLFHAQTSKWESIAEKHLKTFFDAIEEFVKIVIDHITQKIQIKTKIWNRFKLSLLKNKQVAEEKLLKLCENEKQQSIIYNHYYSNNVQKARQNSTRNLIKKIMNETSVENWNERLHINNNSVDAEKLIVSLQKRIIINMNAQTCTKTLVKFSTYYKMITLVIEQIMLYWCLQMTLKIFVDNVCR